ELLTPGRALTFANVAEGAEGLVISDLARAVAARPKPPAVSLAVVCRDGARMQQLARALEFFAPDLPLLQFPAWDCQPYDRVSPHGGILAQRLTTLARLARLQGSDKPLIVLTTVNAIGQRVPAREVVAAQALSVAPGQVVPMDGVVLWLEHNGYNRSSTVREPGEYAVRGGILDLFPAGLDQHVRFDFFGDSLESIRTFDAETQRTLLDMRSLDLVPISEFQLVTESIRRFRMGYVAAFGAPERDDPLYEAVSEGRRHPGMEHWLPLFHQNLDTLFDYVQGATVVLEPLAEDAAHERLAQVVDYYEARRQALAADRANTVYQPLPPDLPSVASYPGVLRRPNVEISLAVLGLESGFETDDLAVICEQDILGDRLVRRRRASKRPEDFIAEVTSLDAGDLVVHVDHGIGRFMGLQTIMAAGAPHDCLELHYADSAKLYLPVENIELLSRYGSEDTNVQLDKLGGAGWQTRKARLKNRIREMAGELIKIAAARKLRQGAKLTVAHGMYEEFCAGFPYDETEDQETV